MDLPSREGLEHERRGSPVAEGLGLAREPGVVGDARPCLNCGYNLAGLHRSGTCPECGAPVARSLQGDLLRYAAPGYVRRLHLGLLLVEVGLCVLMGGVVVGIGAEMAVGAGGLIVLIAVVAAVALTLGGWWLASARDPASTETDNADAMRYGLRTALVIASAATIGVGIPWLGLMAGVAALVAVLAWTSTFLFAMQLLRRLAPRLPDPVVFRRSRELMWAVPLLMTVGWLAVVGPVIGLGMYFALLDRARVALSGARLQRRYEDWPA